VGHTDSRADRLVQDAPMAGGLATTTTIVRSDLWRMGQCRPGDHIRFKRITWESALLLRNRIEQYINAVARFFAGTFKADDIIPLDVTLPDGWDETILHEIPADEEDGTLRVKFRQVIRLSIVGLR
jgi:urea carboxylase